MLERQSGAYWWRTPIGDRASVHDEIVGHATVLWNAYAAMRVRDRIHAKIYRASPRVNSGQYAAALSHLAAAGYGAAKLNVTKSIVDTAVAKLGKDRPMPSAVTDDADWSIKRRARGFTRFMKGKMQETDFERVSPLVLRDAGMFGTGIIKISSAFGEICPERVFKEEIFVDPREARKGKPRQLGQVKQYAREVLAELAADWAPDKKTRERYLDAIRVAQSSTSMQYRSEMFDDDVAMSDPDDQIDVYEWWHLPSSPDAEDGRHTIVIPGCTLLYEEWERPRFPFAFVHWTPPVSGFWGVGLIEELAPLQSRINQIVRDIQMNLDVAGKLIAFVRRGSGVLQQHLVGRFPTYVEYDGQKPDFVVPQAVNPAQLQMLDKFMQWAYDLTGVSQMSAQSRNTLGAGASGVALDNFYDIQSERFAHVQAGYANFRLDCGELYIDAAYDIAEAREECYEGEDESEGKKDPYTAKHVDGAAVERLDWDGVCLQRDQFTLRLESVNFLPDTRAGKIAVVNELLKAGVVDQMYASSLFDEPDIERVNRLQNASYNNLERIMEDLADPDGPMPVVHSFLDLKQATKTAIAYLNRAESDRAPDTVLARYREFIDLAKAHLARGDSAAAGAAVSPPPPPPGAAAPMPGMPGMPQGLPPMPMEAPAAAMGGEMPQAMPSPLPGETPAAPMMGVA